MTTPRDLVTLFEVGPRDGLQNEARTIPVADRIALVDALSETGLCRIECASFVSPRWVPQMAGSGDVLAGITRAARVRYAALTPNMRGLQDALDARADEVAVFASASEGFSKANINATIAESIARFESVVAAGKAAKIPVRGYVSCIIACPFDGATKPAQVADITSRFLDLGCDEISLGDTIGVGTPDTISAMLDAVLQVAKPARLAGHFHDTNGRAMESIDTALTYGLRCFDTSIAGLGGCPYAPGATGNVATETVARHLAANGYDTGLDLPALSCAADLARTLQGPDHV